MKKKDHCFYCLLNNVTSPSRIKQYHLHFESWLKRLDSIENSCLFIRINKLYTGNIRYSKASSLCVGWWVRLSSLVTDIRDLVCNQRNRIGMPLFLRDELGCFVHDDCSHVLQICCSLCREFSTLFFIFVILTYYLEFV